MPNRVREEVEEPFFRQPATIDSLTTLNDDAYDGLVIYCGAGVTIDQTGVSWKRLVRGVFDLARALKSDQKTRTKTIEYLLGVVEDPRQTASIVAEAFKGTDDTDDDFLRSKLHEILYTHNGWSTGLILRNVARFAIMATMFERDVTIITTNYDTFIETEIAKRFKDLVKLGAIKAGRQPCVFRTVSEPGQDDRRIDVMESLGDAGSIELVYLHGRVDGHAASEGRLVLTEDSYAQTRKQSQRILRSHFARKKDGSTKPVLIVGASLTDGPLIDALAITHEHTPGTPRQYRVALTDMPLTPDDLKREFESDHNKTDITTSNVRRQLAMRGAHLGTNMLWPASHTQSAQFLEELRVDLSARKRFGDEDAYTSDPLRISYPLRLKQWSTGFESSITVTDPEFVYRHLERYNKAVKTKLALHGLIPPRRSCGSNSGPG